MPGALTREEVVGSWGQWLSDSWDWDWWVTLTYDPRRPVGASGTHTAVGWSLSDRHYREWLHEVAQDAAKRDGRPPLGNSESPVYFIRGREPNPYRYGTHFHALVGGVATASRRAAWESWFGQHGMARIEPYDPRRGAGWYVSKYVVKQLGDIQPSDNLGAFRRPGPFQWEGRNL